MARKHGLWNTPEWRSWSNMIRRCYDHKVINFARYGGRGITVCDRWRDSFTNFLADMGNRPSTRHTLDRIDSDGNYCPENCRWATKAEQARNRRSTRLLTFQGVTLTSKEWAKRIGISPAALHYRLSAGWSVEESLTLTTRQNPWLHRTALNQPRGPGGQFC